MPDSGRRDYDRQIDPMIEMFIEDRLRDTRHQLKQEIATLAAGQAEIALQATREHGEVKGELRALRQDFSAVRDDIADLTPLRESVSALRQRDEVEAARAHVSETLLSEMRKQRAQTRIFMIGVIGSIAASAGALAALIH